ncbi:MAG: protein kinase [Acidobacteriaceae bacterium]|nr:protein kinase [Acidobacteriaceae bacterium]
MSNLTSPDPLIGTTLSQYEILAKLGGGGMGVVYKARDRRLGRFVALKFLPSQWSHDENAKQRFIREAQAASATQHKHICTIHNIEETPDGQLFIVMAYYDGETLKQRLARGPLSVGEVVEYGAQIAEGLAKAHAQGVVHRDIKPGNIMLSDDEVKLLDFGLATFADAVQLTAPGSTIGTIAYMSPEQVRGEEADARSDLWALGIVLYEMLTGTVPFRGAYPEAVFHAIKNEAIPPLLALRADVPDAVAQVVTRALQKDPAERFASARDLARALRTIQGRTLPLDLQTGEVSTEDVLARRRTRRAAVVRVAGLLGVVALVALGAVRYLSRPHPVERIRVAVAPVANHTGDADLDAYRMALTGTLVDELIGSPNIDVLSTSRVSEIVAPFVARGADVSSAEVTRAIVANTGVPFIVAPSLEYRDQSANWLVRVEIRNAATGVAVQTYETAPMESSLSRQTAYRLILTAADTIQEHFRTHGPGQPFVSRVSSSRLSSIDAARAFQEGMNDYECLEYQAAAGAFQKAAELDPQHALLHAWRARTLVLMNDGREAVAEARRAKTLVTAEAPMTEAVFVDAVLAETTGDLETADTAYIALATRAGHALWADTERADFLKRRQDRNPQAVAAYQALLGQDAHYLRPHVELCQLYTRLNDFSSANREGQLARTAATAAGNVPIEAQALLCLAEADRVSGQQLDEARRNASRARELFEGQEEPYNVARARFYEANIEVSEGHYDTAERLFAVAADSLLKAGNKTLHATAVMNLGVVSVYSGQPTRALSYFEQSATAFREIGDERRAAEMDVNLSGLRIEYGLVDIESAVRTLRNARSNLARMGHVDFELAALQEEALAYAYRGERERARQMLRTALATARDKQIEPAHQSSQVSLAQLDIEAGDFQQAVDGLTGIVKEGVADAESRAVLADARRELGDISGGSAVMEQALRDLKSGGDRDTTSLVELSAGRLDAERLRAAGAIGHFTRAIEAWTDPLPNAEVIAARCERALLQGAGDQLSRARSDIEGAIHSAERLGRWHLLASCRVDEAQLALRAGDRQAARAALSAIGPDTTDKTLGAPLRAAVDYWLGQVERGVNNAAAAAHFETARRAMESVQAALPASARAAFGARPTIRPILQAAATAHN